MKVMNISSIFAWSAQEGSNLFSHYCFARLSMRKQCSSSFKRRRFVYFTHGIPFGMSQSGQRESRNGKNNVEGTNGDEEANPNAERPPGRKAEKAARKRSDSDSDPFIEELKK
jgi:hypothetical protein